MARKKPQQWYNVVGAVHGSKYLGRFKASSAEEAAEMAMESETVYVNLCHHCSDQCEDPEIYKAEASLDDNQDDKPGRREN